MVLETRSTRIHLLTSFLSLIYPYNYERFGMISNYHQERYVWKENVNSIAGWLPLFPPLVSEILTRLAFLAPQGLGANI